MGGVFIKRLSEPRKDGDYYCNERYFINHNPGFEGSDFISQIEKLPLINKADAEFHEYKDYGDMGCELVNGEFEVYRLEIG
ncbi:hypothetical protein COU37_01360 [Candidatus Micrarchaeota archaeon CG10_big_fil_rev_8_21_14_0_10_45_29]|nr:MAG: hypothetical protein COU37_01360 [Candidatus Micrarchaeota archaeon CG10_big_fil_rev_8_21_14_0_10_45_29]